MNIYPFVEDMVTVKYSPMDLTQSQKKPYKMRIAHDLIYPLLTPIISNMG